MAEHLQDIKEIDLILIGKTGNGKSSTGNTILGQKAFLCSANSTSETRTRNSKWTRFENRIITVVDTPGLADTEFKDEADKLKLVTEEVEAIINENPRGFDACLVVLKFNQRFTKEEQICIEALKNIFGDKFVKKHCIFLMTGGDDFEAEFEDSNYSFSDWCKEQKGEFKSVLIECGGKIVLFNNRLKGDGRVSQVLELLKMVDTIGGKYTDKHFQKAKKSRETMMLNAKLPGITDATNREITSLHQKLREVDRGNRFKEIKELIALLAEAKSVFEKLVAQDNKTGVLKGLIKIVESLVSSISEEIKVRERVALETEKGADPGVKRKLELLQLQNHMALMAMRSEMEREVSLLLSLSNSKSGCEIM